MVRHRGNDNAERAEARAEQGARKEHSRRYSPLRVVNLVTWANPDEAQVLGSAEEVLRADAQGVVTIEQPGVVVNMPMTRWPDGER